MKDRQMLQYPTSAPYRSGLAEMGTLALEFTHLAQLTGNHSYFDAVQRITDALEAIQYNTTIPGMWPTFLDASGGCMPEYRPHNAQVKPVRGGGIIGEIVKRQPPIQEKKRPFEEHLQQAADKEKSDPKKGEQGLKLKPVEEKPVAFIPAPPNGGDFHDGKVEDLLLSPTTTSVLSTATSDLPTTGSSLSISIPAKTTCIPAGLKPLPYQVGEEYTLGASADSFYEYLVKVSYVLIGVAQVDIDSCFRCTYCLKEVRISTVECTNPPWNMQRNSSSDQ